MSHPDEQIRMAEQRRAVLAERLLIELQDASTAAGAAEIVTQVLTTVGGADAASVRLRTSGVSEGLWLRLAQSAATNPRGGELPVTVTDRESGLDLEVTGALVPPIAVTRALRALRSTLDRIERQDHLLLQARTDALTGLLNRRAIDERVGVELARLGRNGGVLSLMLLDLDGFKSVNDNLGHQAGDTLLQDVAATILKIARSTDDAGRLGGDEFAILLPGSGADGAKVAADRLCRAVRSMSVPISASVGLATMLTGDDTSAADLIRAADEALYAAKRGGRDRSVHSQDLVFDLERTGSGSIHRTA
ncbi:MAG: diguanylate cyclase (GGDEF)-like protein [Myxococcota bacterium]